MATEAQIEEIRKMLDVVMNKAIEYHIPFVGAIIKDYDEWKEDMNKSFSYGSCTNVKQSITAVLVEEMFDEFCVNREVLDQLHTLLNPAPRTNINPSTN